MSKFFNHPEAEPLNVTIDGTTHTFDINDPVLPAWIDDNDLTAGDYPYDKKLKRSEYEETLFALQEQLVLMQQDMLANDRRMIIVFEGRDAAGKGGSIRVLREFLNPRSARVVALPKPSDREQGQWYFQRYTDHFPTHGEIVIYDRSWYNRGGVEPVMGFCTPEQNKTFLGDVPDFERMIVDEGIIFIKFWLNIGRETQLKRFHDRRHSTVKFWKLSGIDVKGMALWDRYSEERDKTIKATHTKHAPWNIVRYNDKRRGRIEMLKHVLSHVDFAGRDMELIGKPNPKIIGQGPDFLDH
ncbi:MAG: polyphosphate kinase 2 [Pseudomonadota bacterium]